MILCFTSGTEHNDIKSALANVYWIVLDSYSSGPVGPHVLSVDDYAPAPVHEDHTALHAPVTRWGSGSISSV